MSHEYSRITFSRGLNVIVGPNGAGKSSILLALSVALGQTYTERGEKLSDLVRRGKDVGRVSVLLDNRLEGGMRPIPEYSTDTVSITRFIKKNGDYWHYINNRFKAKAEVEHFLSRIGINPENILIIMHQNMIEQFVSRDSREKLLMIEEAVGASALRERIRASEAKLTALGVEEKALQKTLDEARAAVEFWREEYEKLAHIRRLQKRKDELEAEYAWSLVSEAEKSKARLEEKMRNLQSDLEELARSYEQAGLEVRMQEERLLRLFTKSADAQGEETFRLAVANLVEKAFESGELSERLRTVEAQMKSLRGDVSQLEKEISERTAQALMKGSRVDTGRKHQEIAEDIKTVSIQIAGIGKVTPEAEDMYLLAESKYRETELKAGEVSENVKKALEELGYRKELWREFIRGLISDIEPQYDSILRNVAGRGRVELRNLEDIEQASIALFVGFRGLEPSLLDAHTQSGGERIVATLAFLLALQRHVKSPFRAVDEFDVHLDPLNRERIINILTSTSREDPEIQYIIITPGKINFTEDMNLIVVQSIAGKSAVTSGMAEKVVTDV